MTRPLFKNFQSHAFPSPFPLSRLTANYAPYPDGNVPRQGLYFSYRRVCDQYGIPHINTATLGKAIRLCFPTIKTRRLGVRGNSKYHCMFYPQPHHDHVTSIQLPLTDCGIRPATSAEAEFLQDYIRKSNNNAAQSSVNAARMASEQADSANRTEDRSDEDDEEESEGNSSGNASKRNSLNLTNGIKNQVVFADEKTPTAASLLSQAQVTQRPPSASFPSQAPIRRHPGPSDPSLTVASSHPSPSGAAGASVAFLPTAAVVGSVRQMPHFPSIEEAVGVNSTTPQGIAAREVWGWFQDHLDTLLESIRSFRFDQFEMHIRTFWSNLNGAHREVVHAPAVAGLMAKADAIVYDVRASCDISCEPVLTVFFRKYSNSFVLRCCPPLPQHRWRVSASWRTRWRKSSLWLSTAMEIPLSNPRSNSVHGLVISFASIISLRVFHTCRLS